MADVHEPKIRSYNMSQIRSKNTKPELLVRQYFHMMGLRFRLHAKTMPGKPDIVLRKYRTVIFIHGCFWHGHKGCRYFVVPKTNKDFWMAKIEGNKVRDKEAIKSLKKQNWKVIEIWECQLKPYTKDKTLDRITRRIRS